MTCCVADDEEDEEDRFAPEFMRRPKSAHVDEGAAAVFTCQVSADPPASVHWEKDGQRIVSGGRYRVSARGSRSGVMTGYRGMGCVRNRGVSLKHRGNGCEAENQGQTQGQCGGGECGWLENCWLHSGP